MSPLPQPSESYGWGQQSFDTPTPTASQATLSPTEYSGPAYGLSTEVTTPVNGKKIFQCLHPGCKQKPFGRSADLDRHIQKIHFPDSQKEQHNCDYQNCQRHKPDKSTSKSQNTAFTRRDHYRDHLRDYHKEDILKRGRGTQDVTDWLRDRFFHKNATWWRCSKCLNRIFIAKDGWECPECRQMCERERKEVRLEMTAKAKR